VAALSQHVRQLPATLRRSLTWDRGLEMAQHKSFAMATDVQVYFCDPQSPGQRGSNENTNGLLRQYLPKKADLSCYSQSDPDEIALRLNQRQRKTSGFETPFYETCGFCDFIPRNSRSDARLGARVCRRMGKGWGMIRRQEK
jgi:IS30 family transposase